MIAETLPEPEHFVYASDVLYWVSLILVSMVAIVASYHAMQRPRLVVSEVETGSWRARRRDVVKYLLATPFLLFIWTAGLELILLFSNNGLDGVQVSLIAVSLVIAGRILAHVAHEHAHELAKTVPLTVVTLLLITSNGRRTGEELEQTFRDWDVTALSGNSELLLVGTEFAVCALWYWVGVRWWWPRGHDVVGMPKHGDLAHAALLASAAAPATAAPARVEPAAAAVAQPVSDPVEDQVLDTVHAPPEPEPAAPEPAGPAADDAPVTLTEQDDEPPER